MTQSKSHPRKPLALDDLRWFSFADDPRGEKYYTIWQAIWYLLVKSFVDESKFKKYVDGINDAESAFCTELADEYLDRVDLRSLPGGADKYVKPADPDAQAKLLNSDIKIRFVPASFDQIMQFASLEIGDSERGDVLNLLDQRRYAAIEHLTLPEVLHTLLSREIQKHQEGKKSALKIIELKHRQVKTGIPLFSAKSLDSWGAVNSLIALELDDPEQEKPRSKLRADVLRNNRKVMAVMIHLLAELFPESFAKADDPSNPNFSRIQKILGENVDPKASDFPQDRARTDILTKSYAEIADDAPDMAVFSPLSIPADDEALTMHYTNVLAARATKAKAR